MNKIHIPVPYRHLILNISDWYKNRRKIEEKVRSRGYTAPFIQPKAEYLFNIQFSEEMTGLDDIKVVFLFTLNGYCWWFDKGGDITFVDSFQRLIMDLKLYTSFDNVIDLLEAIRLEFGVDDLNITLEEWIRQHLWDVKWCLAGLFSMIIFHGDSRSINEHEWDQFLINN